MLRMALQKKKVRRLIKMARHIFKCPVCHKYTMKERCDDCDVLTMVPKPAKYSPDDPYAKYRRQAKKEQGLDV